MEKSLFERMGGTYEMEGDYRLPCLALPPEETPVGVWGQRQGITERLKAENQMEWVGRMNNCKAQAEEVILTELIYV